MSYEPILVIHYDSLDLHLFDLEGSKNSIDKYLYSLCSEKYQELVIAPGVSINILTCRPELTSFNKSVRDRLYQLDIPYTEHI